MSRDLRLLNRQTPEHRRRYQGARNRRRPRARQVHLVQKAIFEYVGSLSTMAAPRRLKDSRVDFLTKASESLQVAAPSTSAHLGSVRNELMDEVDDKAVDRTVCASCGTKLILGWSCTSQKAQKSKRTRKDRLAEENSRYKASSFKCLTCSAVTVQKIAKPVRTVPATTSPLDANSGRHPFTTQNEKPSAALEASPAGVVKSSNRRSRGKRSSLQALMANKSLSSSTQTPASRLSLQDFLK